MPHLHLVAREVALTNIEKIDMLGAFKPLKKPDDLTKTRYVRIMKRIAEHTGG